MVYVCVSLFLSVYLCVNAVDTKDQTLQLEPELIKP